jgi:hypothetical protein
MEAKYREIQEQGYLAIFYFLFDSSESYHVKEVLE